MNIFLGILLGFLLAGLLGSMCNFVATKLIIPRLSDAISLETEHPAHSAHKTPITSLIILFVIYLMTYIFHNSINEQIFKVAQITFGVYFICLLLAGVFQIIKILYELLMMKFSSSDYLVEVKLTGIDLLTTFLSILGLCFLYVINHPFSVEHGLFYISEYLRNKNK
jgi:hypothetical protein